MFTVSDTTAHVSGKGFTCDITANYTPLNNTWEECFTAEKSLRHHCSSLLDLGAKPPAACGGRGIMVPRIITLVLQQEGAKNPASQTERMPDD